MLLIQPIHDSIYTILSQYTQLTTQELFEIIKKQHTISLSQFYKVIEQLLTKQIIVKEWWKIQFHTTWILWLITFTEDIKNHYLTENQTTALSLQEWEQKAYTSQSLEWLDVIRWNLYSILCLMHPDESPYVYHAHPYYILWMYDTEIANFKALGKKGWYYLTWNTTVLDIYWISLMKELWVVNSIATDTVAFLREWFCINIIGDYIIEVLFPEILTHYFAHYFQTTKNIETFRQDLFYNIFTINISCKCTIRRSHQQAQERKNERHKYIS